MYMVEISDGAHATNLPRTDERIRATVDFPKIPVAAKSSTIERERWYRGWMRTRLSVPLLALSIVTLLVTAPGVSAKTEVYAGGVPNAMNDHGDLGGVQFVRTPSGSSNLKVAMWKAHGSMSVLERVAGQTIRQTLGGGDINNDGIVSANLIFESAPDSQQFVRWRNGGTEVAYTVTDRFSGLGFLGLGTDYRLQRGSAQGTYWVVNGTALDASFKLINGGNGSYVTYQGDNGVGTMTYLDAAAGITAALPAGKSVRAVAPKGTVLVQSGTSGPLTLLRWDAVAMKFIPTELPAYPGAANVGWDVNAGGRVVGSVFGAVGTDAQLWSLRPGGSWENIVAEAAPNGVHSFRVADVNEWGDIVVGYAQGVGADSQWSGAVLTTRVALIGQVGSTAAATGRAGAKVVTLAGGPVPLTAPVNAKGQFSIEVPPSMTGLTLNAPAGTCVTTASGCTTSVPLPTFGPSAKPVVLAKVTAPALAAFTIKKNSAIKVRAGKVSIIVKCTATVACATTVTLRVGAKVVGVGKDTVPARRNKVVVVRLSGAGAALVATKPSTLVAASLTARAGRTSATTVLALKLLR